jgi:hypothetical protein
VVESAGAGNSGRTLTARSTAASLAADRRRNGSGQQGLTREGELPVIPNRVIAQVDNPSYLLIALYIRAVEYAGELLE